MVNLQIHLHVAHVPCPSVEQWRQVHHFQQHLSDASDIGTLFCMETLLNQLAKRHGTVDGRNPAPVDMVNIYKMLALFYTSQVVRADGRHNHAFPSLDEPVSAAGWNASTIPWSFMLRNTFLKSSWMRSPCRRRRIHNRSPSCRPPAFFKRRRRLCSSHKITNVRQQRTESCTSNKGRKKNTLLRVIPTMTCWVEVVRWGLSLRIWWEEWRIWKHWFQVSLA